MPNRNAPSYDHYQHRKTPCPDCGNPKAAVSARCRECSNKRKKQRAATKPAPLTGQCQQCQQPGAETRIGLDHEQTTITLCRPHAAKAHDNYEHHVKDTMLDNLTRQIKEITTST